ncbi:MAG: SIS domain-containing protein [Abditibacteriota bacterium]|nr:SIS domain-containing protein [Abditibacteriota bacterium]
MKDLFDNYPQLGYLRPALEQAVDEAYSSVVKGGKILVCGNGGSAADSEHIAGELLKGFLKQRPLSREFRASLQQQGGAGLADRLQRGIPCISLVSHSALLTAVINDNGAELMYAQQVCALGRKGDVLIGISTSGNARNVCNAHITANALGMTTIGMTGESGGRLGELSQILLNAPASETYRIQEYHIALYHRFCAALEERLFAE